MAAVVPIIVGAVASSFVVDVAVGAGFSLLFSRALGAVKSFAVAPLVGQMQQREDRIS